MSSERDHRRLSLRANVSWTFFANVLNAACWLVMTIVLAKLGSPSDVGTFALGLAATAPIFLFATLRLRDVQATDIQQSYRFADYFALRLITTVFAMASVVALVFIADFESETALVILATGFSKAVEAISDCMHGLFMQYERLDRVAKAKILRGPLELLGLSTGFLVTNSVYYGVLGIIVARSLVLVTYEFPLTIATIRHWSTQSNNHVDHPTFWPRWNSTILKQLMWLALPLGFVQMLTSLNVNIPRYFIDAELGAYSLGIFAAVAAFQKVAPTVVQALGHSASPRLALHHSEGNASAYRRLTLRLIGLATLLGVAGVVVAALLGRQILTLVYGPQYALTDLFVLVMVGAGAHYLATMLAYAITSARRFKIQLPLHALSSISVALICWWLVPRFGLNGAAIGLIVGNLVRAACCLVVVLHIQRTLNESVSKLAPNNPLADPRGTKQVELIGCTGSGKSTIACRMLEIASQREAALDSGDATMLRSLHISDSSSRIARVAAIHLLALRGCFNGFIANLRILRRAWRDLRPAETSWWRKCNQLRKVFKQLGRFRWLKGRETSGLVLVDEGTVHCAHNLFVHPDSEFNPLDVERFAVEIPLPNLLIYLCEDEQTLVERIMRRGHPRIDTSDRAEVTRFIRQAIAVFERLSQHPRIASRMLVIDGGRVQRVPERWRSSQCNELRNLIDEALVTQDVSPRFDGGHVAASASSAKESRGILPC